MNNNTIDEEFISYHLSVLTRRYLDVIAYSTQFFHRANNNFVLDICPKEGFDKKVMAEFKRLIHVYFNAALDNEVFNSCRLTVSGCGKDEIAKMPVF